MAMNLDIGLYMGVFEGFVYLEVFARGNIIL